MEKCRHKIPPQVIVSTGLEESVPLHDKNWFQTGGSARYFCAPKNVAEIMAVLDFARAYDVPLHILGEGANTVISDDGFDGIIMRPALTSLKVLPSEKKSVLVQAGAGVSVRDLITFSLDHGGIGLEEFSAIPGTVGGSVYNNLHYFEYAFSDFVVSAEILNKETGTIETVDNKWFSFGYDFSTLHKKQHIVFSVTFSLNAADEKMVIYTRGRRAEIIRHREKRYPCANTCGCFFRNFYDNEVQLIINGKKIIYVAYYLDALGLKGALRIGNAMVSHQHANMIVNCGNATTADIIAVARAMQERVRDSFGIMPHPECELVGFKKYPLHKS